MRTRKRNSEVEIDKPKVRVRFNGSIYIDPNEYLRSQVYKDRMVEVRKLKEKLKGSSQASD